MIDVVAFALSFVGAFLGAALAYAVLGRDNLKKRDLDPDFLVPPVVGEYDEVIATTKATAVSEAEQTYRERVGRHPGRASNTVVCRTCGALAGQSCS